MTTHRMTGGTARRAVVGSTWILVLAVAAAAGLTRWPELPQAPALSAPHWVIARASQLGTSAELLPSAGREAAREPVTVAAGVGLEAATGGSDGPEFVAAAGHGAYPWDRRDPRNEDRAASASTAQGGGNPAGSGYLWDSGSPASEDQAEPLAIDVWLPQE